MNDFLLQNKAHQIVRYTFYVMHHCETNQSELSCATSKPRSCDSSSVNGSCTSHQETARKICSWTGKEFFITFYSDGEMSKDDLIQRVCSGVFHIRRYPLGYERTLSMPLYETCEHAHPASSVDEPTLVEFRLVHDDHEGLEKPKEHVHLYLRFEETTRLTKSQFCYIQPTCSLMNIMSWCVPRTPNVTFEDKELVKGNYKEVDILETILRNESVCEITHVLKRLRSGGECVERLIRKDPYRTILCDRKLARRVEISLLRSDMRDLRCDLEEVRESFSSTCECCN